MDRHEMSRSPFVSEVETTSLVSSRDCGSILSVLYAAAKHILDEFSNTTNECSVNSDNCNIDLISLANTCATLGNDWLQQQQLHIADSPTDGFRPRLAALYREVRAHLSLLERHVSAASLDTVRSMQAVLSSNEGHWLVGENRMDDAVTAFTHSLAVLDLIQDLNPHQRVDPLRSAARTMCAVASFNSTRTLILFEEAVTLQQTLLWADEQLKQDHFQLAQTLAEAAQCVEIVVASDSMNVLRKDYLRELSTLCEKFSHGRDGIAFRQYCSELLSAFEVQVAPHRRVKRMKKKTK
jgi:hypothetical protein